ncbi:MAG: transglycosylase SLT domain-containing protein [Deltaproteobacteria bacterium]|nr:transglycosylase SLT domain-containing protein [Deltaproteobacteria bacterium]MBW1961328.1 transglycosylase SLT domain-containing protein [Deltaproteobacteria bacterium]MBW1993615.1 transglycosylase SLT domain-containing protein [Deltaproteobacteria bacterium]MBW2152997.1 transglycosylase SLT domain-containing protein [Deltaproteobacteria bacterium]
MPNHSLFGQESLIPPRVTDFPLPKTVSLCGERMPLEDRRVWEMLDREFTISVYDRAQVIMWMKRAGRYFPYIEKKLAEAGMPDDLKYLALAESALIGYVRSRAGAKGYWQFMARTARRRGLRKDRMVDERLHFELSTEAALRHLRYLKKKFGSWTLAMAAYNCGESRLKREIKHQRVKDYYRLNLPVETERYIFRIAAIKIIMENPEDFGYHLPPERIYKPLEVDVVRVKSTARLHLSDVAEALDTDFKTLKELNPHILGYHLPTGRFYMKVPAGKGEMLPAVIARLTPARSLHRSGTYYVVRPGDTLHRISKKTGVSVARLKDINGIRGSLIRAGQKLRLHP